MGRFVEDDRAISEATGVAILIGITIIVTATVGLNVLMAEHEADSEPTANFTYDYVDDQSTLIITHSEGDEFPAGELLIEGPNNEVTWAQASGSEETRPIGPGDIVQIGPTNVYGEHVSTLHTIRIYHETEEDRSQLSEWPG